MDILEKFLHSISYRFPKGYPDINDEQDKKLLESILEETIGSPLEENLNSTAQEAKDILKKEFDLKDDSFLKKSSTSFKVLMDDKERRDFIEKASRLEDFTFEPLGSSSIGRLKYHPEGAKKGVIIYAKPANLQGIGSAGKRNEHIFIQTINEKIAEAREPLDITISAPGFDDLIVRNVTKAVDSSKSGVQAGSKSDVQLYGEDESTPLANLSLKQDGGFIWASVRSDLTFSPFIKTFLKKLLAGEIKGLKLKPNPKTVGEKYLMYNDEGERVTLVVIDDFPKGFEERVIFGNESPKVIVIGRTFNDSDFQLQNNKLNIKSSGIYRTLEEVDKAGQSPTFLIAQHINMPYGLDFRIFPANTAKIGPRSRGIKLSFNDIVDKTLNEFEDLSVDNNYLDSNMGK